MRNLDKLAYVATLTWLLLSMSIVQKQSGFGKCILGVSSAIHVYMFLCVSNSVSYGEFPLTCGVWSCSFIFIYKASYIY